LPKKASWEKFEIESCQFLNEEFSDLGVIFQRAGGTNSNTSDIEVLTENKELFSTEAKFSPSQSGQFVIIEEKEIYTFSNNSKFESNIYTKKIIDYLNENKENYSPKGQKSIELKCDKKLLFDWIIEHYKTKDSYFVITSNRLNDYKAIIPIDDINRYFHVSAVIRRKRSGTRDIAQYKIRSSIKELTAKYREEYGEIDEIITSKKTLVRFKNKVELKKSERYFGSNYFLSPSDNIGEYFIKERSNTNNLNVIFSLEYKGPERNIGIDFFRNFICKELKEQKIKY